MDRNADAFSACFSTLAHGRLIGIYPEGTTHSEARVQRIKTGAARIALEYEAGRHASGGEPLALVPVGLTFEARKSFSGRVRVSFGEPIAVAAYLAAYRDDPVKAVDALTTAIQWAMEAEIVHVTRLDRAELVRAVEELYRGELVRELQAERGLGDRQIDTFRLSQSIADAVAHFEARDPERVERIARQVGGTAPCSPPTGCATRPCARASRAAGWARAPALLAGLRGPAGLRLWRRGQRAAVLRAALDRPPHRATRRRLRDDAAPRQRRRVSALLGPRDLDRLARRRRRSGPPPSRLAAAERAARLSLPRRRGTAADLLRFGVLSLTRQRRLAAARRAPGHHRRARARQERLSRRHEREHLLSVHLLEEMSTPALDALDRDRTVVILTVSPLEEHGPHLPVGVDAFTARYFAEAVADRVVAERPGWSAVLAPTLHLGAFAFEAVGTVSIRQRVVRDAVVDYGDSLARSGFRHILIANGHAGRVTSSPSRRPRPSCRAATG